MRFAPACLLFLGLVACKGEPFRPDAKIDAPLDAEFPWWTPVPGEAKDWDVQLSAFDITATRQMYDLDLWAIIPSPMTITYDDSSTVMVPAGALPGAIADLKGRTPKPILVCHVNMGAIKLNDPDAMKFPGWEMNPPDRPTPPAASSVVGWSTGPNSLNERYLDIREGANSRDKWKALMWKRIDLAKQIGCDAIEPDHVDSINGDPGWDFRATPEQQTSWYMEVANAIHARELSAGMKGGNTLPDQPDTLAGVFDWMMIERCGEFDDCGTSRPFINRQKAVFVIEYDPDSKGDPANVGILCGRHATAQIMDGIVKDEMLTGAVRTPCP